MLFRSRSVEGPIRRCTLSGLRLRSLRVAQALERDGVKLGDRIATMAWNTDRHVETWFGIMGLGAICHTLNPRLFADQLIYIVNHAEDRMIFVDLTFVPILQAVADKLGKRGYWVSPAAAEGKFRTTCLCAMTLETYGIRLLPTFRPMEPPQDEREDIKIDIRL